MKKFVILNLTLAVLISVVDGNLPKKIYGGRLVYIEQHPYIVSIQYQNAHFCGGTIISPQLILTAATCISPEPQVFYSNLQVITGTNDLSAMIIEREVYQVANVIIHEDYDPRDNWKHDIAILKVESEIEFSQVCDKADIDRLSRNGNMHVLGWGINPFTEQIMRYLHKLQVRSLSPKNCNEKYYTEGQLHRNQHCLVLPPNSAVVQGNAGSPVMSGRYIIGIISIKPLAIKPPIYTRVYKYEDWIEEMSTKI